MAPVSGVSRAVAAALLLGATASLAGSCAREAANDADASSAEEQASLLVRQTYGSPDAVAAAAYTWTAPTGTVFVLVDVESGIEGVVQARADLWAVGDSAPTRLGRSDVMASAATIGAFAFEDVTGDGVPDLLGYVADSAGTAYPVFLPGARGMMADQIEPAAAGFRLSAEPDVAPRIFAGPRGPCALQLWAEGPAPDSAPAGWRYLALRPSGELGPPTAVPPRCQ
jgi:hypothetical protein